MLEIPDSWDWGRQSPSHQQYRSYFCRGAIWLHRHGFGSSILDEVSTRTQHEACTRKAPRILL